MRITNTMLEARVKTLNEILKRPIAPWTEEGDRYRANIGNYHLSGQNGYTSLHVMCNENGGVHSMFSGTKQGVMDYINAFLAGYRQAQEDKEGL